MKIRKYQSSDYQIILNLLRLNTPKYFAIEEEKDLIYYLENHVENFFVLEADEQILGCGGYNFTDDLSVGKLSWDIIHPQYQGKGCGTKLTQYRIDALKTNQSVKSISVRTSQLVYQFYEKFGFETREIIKDYWAKGFDLYRMDLSI